MQPVVPPLPSNKPSPTMHPLVRLNFRVDHDTTSEKERTSHSLAEVTALLRQLPKLKSASELESAIGTTELRERYKRARALTLQPLSINDSFCFGCFKAITLSLYRLLNHKPQSFPKRIRTKYSESAEEYLAALTLKGNFSKLIKEADERLGAEMRRRYTVIDASLSCIDNQIKTKAAQDKLEEALALLQTVLETVHFSDCFKIAVQALSDAGYWTNLMKNARKVMNIATRIVTTREQARALINSLTSQSSPKTTNKTG